MTEQTNPAAETPSTPDGDVPPLPEPWRPVVAEGSGVRNGCGKPALFGCGCLLLVLGAAALVLVARAEQILEWGFSLSQQAITEHLPEEVTAADRDRLEKAFAAVPQAVLGGEVTPAEVQELQAAINRALKEAQRDDLSRDEVLELIAALEAVGKATPASGERR